MDEETGNPLVEMILDQAGQKGTGRWTAQIALELGAPIPTISSAVEARIISSYKNERVKASDVLGGPTVKGDFDAQEMIGHVGHALYAAKICSYAQGFAMLKAADAAHGFGLNYPAIAKIWRAGCIIRARFLNDVSQAFDQNPQLDNLMLAPFFAQAMNQRHDSLRQVAAAALGCGGAPAGHVSLFGLLRRLPLRAASGQPDSGPAGLFRGPHLPQNRPGGGVPQPVDLMQGAWGAGPPKQRPLCHASSR